MYTQSEDRHIVECAHGEAYIQRDIYTETTYTYKEYTRKDIHSEKSYMWRDIPTNGSYTRRDLQTEGTYTRRETYTEGHTQGGTYTRKKILAERHIHAGDIVVTLSHGPIGISALYRIGVRRRYLKGFISGNPQSTQGETVSRVGKREISEGKRSREK